MEVAEAGEFVQGAAGERVAGFDGGVLLDAQQGLLYVVVVFAHVYAPALVHGVFGAFEVSADLGGRAFGGEDKDGGAARFVAFGGVGVDGDEDVGVAAAGNGGAFVQRDVGVAVAGEEGAEAFFGVEVFFQAVCDLQDDVFFAQAGGRVDRASVFAAVAGVDGDDDGAFGDGGRGDDFVLFFDASAGGDVALHGDGRGRAALRFVGGDGARRRDGGDVRLRAWRGQGRWRQVGLRQRGGLHEGRRRAVRVRVGEGGGAGVGQGRADGRAANADAAAVAHGFQRFTSEDDVGRLVAAVEGFEGECLFGEVVVDVDDDAVAASVFRRHGVDVGFGGVAQVDDDAQGGGVAEAGADAGDGTAVEGHAGAAAAAGVGQVQHDARWPGKAELAEDGRAVEVEDELGFVRQTVVAHVLQGDGQRLHAAKQGEEQEQQGAGAQKCLDCGSQGHVSCGFCGNPGIMPVLAGKDHYQAVSAVRVRLPSRRVN